MNDFSIWSIIFITIPEQFLILMICLAVSGDKYIFDFKKSGNMLRFFMTVMLMIISSVLLANLIDSANTTKFLMQVLIYMVFICIFYRHSIIRCFSGLLVSTVVVVIGEAVSLSIILEILQISVDSIYDLNTWSLILFSLPTRLIQVGCLLATLHFRKINVEVKKLNRSESIMLIVCLLIIVMNMYQIEYLFSLALRDLQQTVIMFSNTVITSIFSIFSVYRITKIEKKLSIASDVHNVDLHWIKQLIEEGRSEYAKELIDLTLKEKNYY